MSDKRFRKTLGWERHRLETAEEIKPGGEVMLILEEASWCLALVFIKKMRMHQGVLTRPIVRLCPGPELHIDGARDDV